MIQNTRKKLDLHEQVKTRRLNKHFLINGLAAKMLKNQLIFRIFSISPPIENKKVTNVCKIGSIKKTKNMIKTVIFTTFEANHRRFPANKN